MCRVALSRGSAPGQTPRWVLGPARLKLLFGSAVPATGQAPFSPQRLSRGRGSVDYLCDGAQVGSAGSVGADLCAERPDDQDAEGDHDDGPERVVRQEGEV